MTSHNYLYKKTLFHNMNLIFCRKQFKIHLKDVFITSCNCIFIKYYALRYIKNQEEIISFVLFNMGRVKNDTISTTYLMYKTALIRNVVFCFLFITKDKAFINRSSVSLIKLICHNQTKSNHSYDLMGEAYSFLGG